MAIEKAIKKQLEIVNNETDQNAKKLLLALLVNLGRDLLSVEKYEKIFNVELIEH